MHVSTTHEGGIACVRLQRPPANAMEPVFLDEIAEKFSALASNDAVKAVVLTGTRADWFFEHSSRLTTS